MKRLTLLPLAFLMALFLSLTASAADYAIHSVTLDGGAVTVSVTAPNDCALWVGAYSADGVMIAADGANVSGKADAQTLTLNFDGVASDAYAKAFLFDSGTFAASCAPADTRKSSGETVYTSDVYAILYADGTMVFQHGDTPESGREVKNTYAVDMAGSYNNDNYAPWYDEREAILQVEFSDKIQPKSTAYWFYECANLKEIKSLNYLDTSHVTNMRCTFIGCETLVAMDINSFNTSNVTDMGGMFSYCTSLTVLDIGNFDTSNVTNMGEMFYYCMSLTTLDVGNFNTSNVTNMKGMFCGCTSLTTLDVDSFNTSNATSMDEMFAYCESLTALNISNFNTINVAGMYSMFRGCSSLTTLDVSKFNTTHVIDTHYMFFGCDELTALDVSGFDTSNVTDMSYMFGWCALLTELDVSGFNTSNVGYMRGMFWDCTSLTKIYASDKFVTSQVTVSGGMFDSCTSLVGGAGTTYDKGHVDVEYARIDGGPDNPGYFTAKS